MTVVTVHFVLAAVLGLQVQGPAAGSISGVVVNASRDFMPTGEAEVVLRVMVDGQFVVAAEGLSDNQGRFVFDNIPADTDYIYLPGANRAGVHYPGSRVVLSKLKPHLRVNLQVHDSVSHPNPLVIRRHDISIQPETDALRVTETLHIENPSSKTYVGRPAKEGSRATTLRLSIPSNFRRTTFHKEFYGRQFVLIDGRLATDIPWPPGQRELAFTYTVPNQDRNRVWKRPLDLPCNHLRIVVHSDSPEQTYCNVGRAVSQTPRTITFESIGETLPASHVLELRLQSLPTSFATYGRWLAVVLLLALIVATGLIGTRHHRRKNRTPIANGPSTAKAKRAA